MVVRVLLDPTQRFELGEHGAGRPQVVEQLDPAQRVGAADEQPQLGELALPGRLAGACRFGAGERDGSPVELEPELSAEPGRPQDPQWVVRQASRRRDAEHATLDVGDAAGRIERRTGAGKRQRERIYGEVAHGEIGLDRLGTQTVDVDMPAPVTRLRPPGRELGGELERGSARRRGEPPCGIRRIAGEREIDVDHVALENRVADGPADDPGLVLVTERAPRALDRGDRVQAPEPTHRTYSRGIRSPSPHVIS